MKFTRVIGLMSGTSLDGIDAALVEFQEGSDRPNLRGFVTLPYPGNLKDEVYYVLESSKCELDKLCALDRRFGEAFGQAALEVATQSGFSIDQIDLIGSHGQTIFHAPHGVYPWTLQIGSPAAIAVRTGVTTIGQFRQADMAAGGEGAPLVPFADWHWLRHATRSRAVQNIGGIGNVTFLPAAGDAKSIIAFDTGPGNLIMDRLVWGVTKGQSNYDKDGHLAASGQVNQGILTRLMEHRFLQMPPPKSTGREDFGAQFADRLLMDWRLAGLSPEDMLATATAFTAHSIVDSYRRFLPKIPDEMVICGGGARNQTLLKSLAALLPQSRVMVSDDLGINADAKEAMAFALFAYQALRGEVNHLPQATGARESLVLGQIVPGRNFKQVMLK